VNHVLESEDSHLKPLTRENLRPLSRDSQNFAERGYFLSVEIVSLLVCVEGGLFVVFQRTLLMQLVR
jgi:hypothetical protein